MRYMQQGKASVLRINEVWDKCTSTDAKRSGIKAKNRTETDVTQS